MSAISSIYAVGQVWRCKGRTSDETPTLLIDRIEQHPLDLGAIIHVTLRDLRIRHPGLPDRLMTSLAHVPMIAQTFELSEAMLVGSDVPDPAYEAGYAQWKTAFDAGQAGSYGISVAAILDTIERQLNSLRAH
jgi:hypothetical protein